MTKRKRKPAAKSRSGPNLPDAERGTPQLNTRVARASREAYEREAQRRGISLGALVRERLESAPWCEEGAT